MKRIENFRDFGGYRTQNGLIVKRGMLYRSGSLAKASDDDLAKLSSLGIRTVCDLRTHQERSNNPDRIPGNSNVKSIHIPIKVTMHNESGVISQLFALLFGEARRLDYAQVAKQIYREYAVDFRPEFSEIIKLAAEGSNLPILIHCTAGKDRTGLACGLIQLMLGVPLESVTQDYLLTNGRLHEFKDAMLNRLRFLSIFGISRQKFLPLFEARSEYLEAAFDQMRHEYGTVENYVRDGLGFSDKDRLGLKDLLLEKSNSNGL